MLNVFALYIPIFLYRFKYRKILVRIDGDAWDVRRLVKLLDFTILLSSLGYAARFFDKFVVRGVSLSGDMAQRLEAVQDTSGTAIGLVAAFIFPLSISAFVLAKYIRVCNPLLISRTKMALIIFLLFLPAIESSLLGKRGAMMTLVVTYLLVSAWMPDRGNISTVKRASILFAIAISFLVSVIFLLTLRLDDAGSVVWMLEIGRVTELIKIDRDLLYWVSELKGLWRDLIAGILGIVAYFVHGFYEYCYQYDQFLRENAQYGGYTFWIVKKFMAMLGVGTFDIDVVINVPPRTFIYTTLFGPLYLDFLHGSVLFSFLIGLLSCFFYHKSRKNIFYLPLYIQFAIVIMFYPVVDMLTMFQGLYNFVAAAAFLILGSSYMPKRREYV
jgi:hypothetical protein